MTSPTPGTGQLCHIGNELELRPGVHCAVRSWGACHGEGRQDRFASRRFDRRVGHIGGGDHPRLITAGPPRLTARILLDRQRYFDGARAILAKAMSAQASAKAMARIFNLTDYFLFVRTARLIESSEKGRPRKRWIRPPSAPCFRLPEKVWGELESYRCV